MKTEQRELGMFKDAGQIVICKCRLFIVWFTEGIGQLKL